MAAMGHVDAIVLLLALARKIGLCASEYYMTWANLA